MWWRAPLLQGPRDVTVVSTDLPCTPGPQGKHQQGIREGGETPGWGARCVGCCPPPAPHPEAACGAPSELGPQSQRAEAWSLRETPLNTTTLPSTRTPLRPPTHRPPPNPQGAAEQPRGAAEPWRKTRDSKPRESPPDPALPPRVGAVLAQGTRPLATDPKQLPPPPKRPL